MQVEFKNEVNFKILNVGDFFLCDGHLFFKIPEEESCNAVSLTQIQNNEPSLTYFPDSLKCQKVKGKIVIE